VRAHAGTQHGDPPPAARVPGIDAIRGLAVLAMAVGNLGLGVAWVPDWLKHTPDVGFTVADLVAPLFVVLSGFTLGPAVRRRLLEGGLRGASSWLALRSLALIGIGAVITAGEAVLDPPAGSVDTWGVLQAIGAATMLTGLVILLRPWLRVVAGLLVLGCYQALLDAYWLDIVRRTVHNGLLGSLAWAGLMMIASGVADAWRAAPSVRRRVGRLVTIGVVSVALALVVAPLFPIAKARASASYMLFTFGLSLLLVAFFDAVTAVRPGRLLWLQRVGRHPLALYLTHLLLLAPLTLAGNDTLYANAAPLLTIVEAGIVAAALVSLARLLDHKGWVLRL
jgi:predicted acyltransferase